MDIEEAKKQISNWFDSKLNNPYFGAVIAVWVVTNRVALFGLFNFEKDSTLDQRISFVHRQLESFNRLNFLFGFHGFWATVVWAFFWGLVVMLFMDQLNTAGKSLFKLGHRTYSWALHKIEPPKWIERKTFEEEIKKSSELEDDINKKREEVNRLQNLYDESQRISIERKKEIEAKDLKYASDAEKIKLQDEQIRQSVEEKNKFKIIYARYGKNETFIEVTKAISDLISSKGNFNVTNESLGFDPMSFAVKELFIEYEVNMKAANLLANEYELVELKDSTLVATPTEESQEKQSWVQNQIKAAEIFTGEWYLTWTYNGIPNSEKVRIDKTGKYFANDIHKFDLLISKLENKSIEFNKIDVQKNRIGHSVETLTIQDDKLISGNDNIGNKLEYRKIGTESIVIGVNIAVRDKEKLFEAVNENPEFENRKIVTHENSVKKNYFTFVIEDGNDLLYIELENLLKRNKIEYIDYHLLGK
jgi:hypothetical protein